MNENEYITKKEFEEFKAKLELKLEFLKKGPYGFNYNDSMIVEDGTKELHC